MRLEQLRQVDLNLLIIFAVIAEEKSATKASAFGEVTRLKWDQVDFMANTIGLRTGETKNDSGRNIPIVPQLRVLLAEPAWAAPIELSVRLFPFGQARPGC